MGWLRKRVRIEDDDPSSRKYEELTESEREWVKDHLDMADTIVKHYLGEDAERSPPDLASLDQAFAAWLADWPPGLSEAAENDPNPYINAFGAAFGQTIVDGLGFEWKIVTDPDGTDLAVHGQPGDTLMYPANLVAKRFARDEVMFMESIYAEIAQLQRDVSEGRSPA